MRDSSGRCGVRPQKGGARVPRDLGVRVGKRAGETAELTSSGHEKLRGKGAGVLKGLGCQGQQSEWCAS